MTSVGNARGRPELVQWELGFRLTYGQSPVDFVVFDDVGPVFDDPVSAALLVVEEVSKVFGGVVERQLPCLQSGDDRVASRPGRVGSHKGCRPRVWRTWR